jgi:DNA-binding NarL/FixJ family response regulator
MDPVASDRSVMARDATGVDGRPETGAAQGVDDGRPWSLLTPRERQVVVLVARGADNRQIAGLVARGRSNREIADELVVSERTVEWHVANVLGKLGLDSRAQVAVWAFEHRMCESQTA